MWNIEPIILNSAYRHNGGADEDMFHALRNSVRRFVKDDAMVMVIGPARDGVLIEVGLIEWHGERAIVHCMRPARARFLRG